MPSNRQRLLASITAPWLITQMAWATPSSIQGQARPLEALSKEALIGFDRPDWCIQKEIETERLDGNYVGAKANLAKLLAGNPNSLFLIHERGILLFESGAKKAGIEQIEKAIKMADERGEHYRVFFDDLGKSYVAVGDYAKAATLLQRMLVLFPHSRSNIARSLDFIEHKIATGGTPSASGGQFSLDDGYATPGRATTGSATLMDVASPDKDQLAPGWAYQFIARTSSLPRFKLTLTESEALGDTGVVQFLLSPPAYVGLTLIQHESHNYFKVSVANLSSQLSGPILYRQTYEKISKIGDVTVSGVACTQYKCQLQDDSTFDIVTLTRAVPVRKAIAKAASVICRVPQAACLVVSTARVVGGFVSPKMQTYSIKKIKVDPALFKVPASYHQSNNMTEFTWASDGAMKKEDLDQVMKSR